MQTIMDCGEELNVTDAEASRLTAEGIIYKCGQADCLPFYHIDPKHSWESLVGTISGR